MEPSKEIEKKLEQVHNWILISNKKNVLKGLEKLLGRDENVLDLLDGLYRGIKISDTRDIAGVFLVTDRRLLFVTSELSGPQYEELPFRDIRGIAFERAFSSIIITLKLKSTQVTFKTFDNRSAVVTFIDAINSRSGGTTAPREDSTLRILAEISDTMKTLEKMNRTIAAGAADPAGKQDKKLSLDTAKLDFLFNEAKKINRTVGEILGQVGDPSLKNSLINDIILLSSLCSMADGVMSDAELMFVSLVLIPLNPDGSATTATLAEDLFRGDSFPQERGSDLIAYWYTISGYIKQAKPGLDLEGYSLKTMNLLENSDREKGTRNADRAGTILYTFAQCLMKADGPPTAEEEERLKQIYRLINRGAAALSTAVAVKEAEEEETLDSVMEKINALVGMDKIKEQIATLVNLIKVQKEREERKLPVTPLSLHSVFYGPPGTGKTTIARLLGKVYKCLGLLKRGQLVETDRAGLVAGYVGQTAINVDNVVQKALDGVLFIDEAYALIPDDIGGRDFGQEAVNTILKRMEDYRDRLVVIVAGYTEEMERFILSNPGLKSRFSRYFYFDHYRPEDLLAIFDSFCKNAEFRVPREARDRALSLFASLYEKRDRTFGNGRAVRNIFERIVERQANRIAGISPLTDEILCTIAPGDVPDEKDLVG